MYDLVALVFLLLLFAITITMPRLAPRCTECRTAFHCTEEEAKNLVIYTGRKKKKFQNAVLIKGRPVLKRM